MSMKTIFQVCCLFLVSQFSYAQSSTPLNVSFDDVLALPVSEPTAVSSYGSNELQFGKLWVPDASLQPAPLVVVIHGGCWLNSFDVHHTDALNHGLVNDGFAVWAFEYRRTGDEGGGWPGTYDDVLQAIAYTEQLTSYGVDPDRLAIIGHSAGGHLALLAGIDVPEANIIVSLAGIADIESYAEGSSSCEVAATQFIGGSLEESRDTYRAANPALKELHPNTVLMHGEIDAIVPLSQIESLSEQKIVVPGAGHFDWIHAQTDSYKQLVQQLKQALQQ